MKGQTALVGIIFFFIILVVGTIFMKPVISIIGEGLNNTPSTYVHFGILTNLVNYVPLFIVIFMIISLFFLTIYSSSGG